MSEPRERREEVPLSSPSQPRKIIPETSSLKIPLPVALNLLLLQDPQPNVMPPTITPDVPALKGLSFATMDEAMMAIRSQAAKYHVIYKAFDRNKTRAYL